MLVRLWASTNELELEQTAVALPTASWLDSEVAVNKLEETRSSPTSFQTSTGSAKFGDLSCRFSDSYISSFKNVVSLNLNVFQLLKQ